MAVGIYLCDVKINTAHPLRPPYYVLPPQTGDWKVQQIFSVPPPDPPGTGTGKGLIASSNITLSGTGLTLLLSGTSVDDLKAKGRGGAAGPTNQQRTQVNNWLTSQTNPDTGQPFVAITAAQASNWKGLIEAIAQQREPAFDLDNLEF